MSEFILIFNTFQTLINNNNSCAHFDAEFRYEDSALMNIFVELSAIKRLE